MWSELRLRGTSVVVATSLDVRMPEPPIRRRLGRHHDKYVLLGAIANEFADRIEDDEIALEQHGIRLHSNRKGSRTQRSLNRASLEYQGVEIAQF